MILTLKWLNDFLDIKDVDTDTISRTLNRLGLEVESIESKKVVDNIVVGYVKECKKHSNADKLNVCLVDVGNEVLQIVCGAKNVKEGIYVGVAKIGAILIDGLEIKKTTIRDVQSSGMICSHKELGYMPLNNGIMILDESIGKLELGKELNSYDIFNDTIIDIDITPNRGDCLSILGVARDLACGLDKDLKNINLESLQEDSSVSIDKCVNINFDSNVKANLKYKMIDKSKIQNNFCIDLLYSYINSDTSKSAIDKFIEYISHSTGVVFNAYNIENLSKDNIKLNVAKNDKNLTTLSLDDGTLLCTTGVSVSSHKDTNNEWLLLEASYEPPIELCKNVANSNIKTSPDIFFKSSRGSNPDVCFGIDYLKHIAKTYNLDIKIAGGHIQSLNSNSKREITCSHLDIVSIIGNDISISQMSDILNSLSFETTIDTDLKNLTIKIPPFRHDIFAIADIAEEILRVFNIDSIVSKPLLIKQERVISDSFTKYIHKRKLRDKCVNLGFFENISFVFSSKQTQEQLGFEICDKEIDIVNPITNDLNTLRSTIILNLLQAVKNNKNNNFDRINLFEIGSIFDKQRNEKNSIAFVSSGLCEIPNITNNAKPKNIDFYTFTDKISNIISGITLNALEQENNELINPYQSASVWLNDEYIGYISKLHSKIQNDMKIDDTFVAEFDLNKIFDLQKKNTFKHISKFPVVYRDLSLVVDKTMHYSKIRDFINKLEIKELKSFSPIDIFVINETQVSISIRFALQSDVKTLNEEDINTLVIDSIYDKLSSSLKVSLRE